MRIPNLSLYLRMVEFEFETEYNPDSIPPSDRRWANVGTSVGPTLAADVGPTAF